MTMLEWSFIFSIVALTISVWGRFETYFISRRLYKIEQAKRIGEALVSAQILKNTLSENIQEFDKILFHNNTRKLNTELLEEFSKQVEELKKEYDKIWEYVKLVESATIEIAKGQKLNINVVSMEARIAHFNQRKVLAQFDIQTLNSFWKNYQFLLNDDSTLKTKGN